MTVDPRILLPPFEVHRPIGRGGMSVVWQGQHVTQPVPVAVKVLMARRAASPVHVVAFRQEVRALATLHHPNIVMVLDHGTVPSGAAEASRGALPAGSPYLVMELASGGSLRRLLGHAASGLRWSHVRALLFALLDGLAHAHTRGVVHRDLKPANVLLNTQVDGSAGLKITDFGIAHALDAHPADVSADSVYGTPGYMAPEMFLEDLRKVGPWTDLYSVGCVAFELLTGSRPFPGERLPDVVRGHLKLPPPPLEARFPVPAELEGWLHLLLAKAPEDRYQRAADAAWALGRMPFVDDGGDPWVELMAACGADGSAADAPIMSGADFEALALQDVPLDGTATLVDGHIPWPTAPRGFPRLSTLGALDDRQAVGSAASDALHWPRIPPLPPSWERPVRPPDPIQLVGAGLRLYGLRALPLVGRQAERDAVWEQLAAVRSSGDARAVVLRGTMGTGKSRVAEWMAQRAEEVGSAQVLTARNSPVAGPRDGLSWMFARALGTTGLDHSAALEHLARWVRRRPLPDDGPYEASALAELVDPQDPQGTGSDLDRNVVSAQLASPEARLDVARRALCRLGLDRPIVVWLDDVQWGVEPLALADYVLTTHQSHVRCPALFVLTVGEEELAQRPVAAKLLSRIVGRAEAREVALGRLEPDDHRRLVERLLRLEGPLVEEVVSRTDGNPLFAVQLVGDWVQRGLLEVGEHGFRVQAGASAAIPDDIFVLWQSAVDRFAAGRSEGLRPARVALEAAAALGRQVDPAEWSHVCRLAGCVVGDDFVGELAEHRLVSVDREGNGWALGHQMLVEALERSARAEHRWPQLNLACAHMLRDRYGARGYGMAERRGRHLVHAGELFAALDPLLQGAQERRHVGDYVATLELLDLRDQVLSRVGGDSVTLAHLEGAVVRARVYSAQSRLDEAESLLSAVSSQRVELTDWWRAQLDFVDAMVRLKRGSYADAELRLQWAIGSYESSGFAQGVAESLMALGKIRRFQGDAAGALDYYGQALEQSRSVGDAMLFARSLMALGELHVRHDAWAEGVSELERALALFEQLGARERVGAVLNDLGEAARLAGDLAAAEHTYRRSAEALDSVGSRDAAMPRLNAAIAAYHQGRHDEARGGLLSVLRTFTAAGRRPFMAVTHINLAACEASLGRLGVASDHLASARELMTRSSVFDVDVALPAEQTGDRALAVGALELAGAAYDLALEQWRALGDAIAVDRVTVALHRLVGRLEGRPV